MSPGVAGGSDLLPHHFICPLITAYLMSFKNYFKPSAVDMPLLGIPLQVTPIRLENPAGFPHLPQLLFRQLPFFLPKPEKKPYL